MNVRLDLETTLNNLGGDRALMQHLCQIIVEDAPTLLEKLNSSIVFNDRERSQHLIHSLRGMFETFGAEPATSLALELESELTAPFDRDLLTQKLDRYRCILQATLSLISQILSDK